MYLIINQKGEIKDYTGHYQYVRRQKNGVTAGCSKEVADAVYCARSDVFYAISPTSASEDSHIVVETESVTAAQLSVLQQQKQSRNNLALAAYLSANPVTWQAGKQYGITQEDQNEMSLNLIQYQAMQAAGIETKLEWHAAREECREFEPEEYMGLTMLISNTVIPLVRRNQAIKAAIFAAQNLDELEAVQIAYP